ncbi:MAG: hypothetical protein Q7S59_00295 [Sulfurimonas sp.]|nr:hypothetical protein [Sulfurimonas sp.]
MTKKLLLLLDRLFILCINYINTCHIYIINKYQEDKQNKYQYLIPTDGADKDGKYSEALFEALENNKVRNIAVSGSYGSGKSSFLRTFENNHIQWKFLDISLASFKSDKQPDDSLIEKGILQQMFYKVKSSSIPQSRFKRLNPIKISTVFLIFLSILSFLLYFDSSLFGNLYFPKDFMFIPASIILITLFYFIKLSLKNFSSISLEKINLNSLEIKSNEENKESILNRYLDEILYFFEVTNYNIVVFQDLDRFESLEIFTKLRELNNLINNSEQVNKKLVFIYAIKDDMFKNETKDDNNNRTKFFDFMIPIIPYINSSNSYEKLLELFENENIEDDFLRDISLYIEDMRLLNNIYNEYKIYDLKIGNKLNKTKLLAIIVYKNFHPSDFVALHKNQGMVYDVFNNKAKYISTLIKDLDLEIETNKTNIKNIGEERQTDIEELRMIYLYKIVQKLTRVTTHLYLDNKSIPLSNATEDKNFELLRTSGTIKYDQWSGNVNFTNIENEIDKDNTYPQREARINKKLDKIMNKLKQDIETIQSKKAFIKSYSIREIVHSTAHNSVFSGDIGNQHLLKYLIKEGYINEDYYIYISYFHENSITEKDREFLLSIKNEEPLDFSFTLNNIEQLIKMIRPREFDSKAVMNFHILTFMFQNNIKDESFQMLLKNLSDGSKESKRFIFSYIDVSTEQKSFIKNITKTWIDFWTYIDEESDFTEDKKYNYLRLILNYADIDDIMKIAENSSLKEYISNQENLYPIDETEKYEEIIKRLNIKFKYFENLGISEPLFNYIYNNHCYQLHEKMINKMAILKGKPQDIINENLKIAHFTTLKNANVTMLIEYIYTNINEYIENVFLKIETNTQESEEVIIELLNNKNIIFNNKVSIVEKEETKIKDISKITEDMSIWIDIIKNNKIESNWDNLLSYYQEVSELSSIMINFINQEKNYKEISKNKMSKRKIFAEKLVEKFSEEILLSNDISDEAYSLLLKDIWFAKYPELNVEHLSSKKIDILLENVKMALTKANIDILKEHFKDKHITLIENFKDEFLEEFDELLLGSSDYEKLLKSSKLSKDDKLNIIEKISLSLYDTDEDLVHTVIGLYIENNTKIEFNIFDKLFDKANREDALKLLTLQIKYLEIENITSYLKQFAEPYCDIADLGSKPLKLDNNEINLQLINALNEKHYISSRTVEKTKIKVNRKRV